MKNATAAGVAFLLALLPWALAEGSSPRGVACLAGPPPVEAKIAVAQMPAGPSAPDTLSPHFFNSAASVVASGASIGEPMPYLSANDHTRLIAETRYCGRDMEVETWTRHGTVLLRKTDDGRAIYFFHRGDVVAGLLEIGIVVDYREGRGFRERADGGKYHVLYHGPVAATGYTAPATAGQHFTFGVHGFDIYARFNGVEFLRFKDYRHVDVGTVAFQANVGSGFRDIAVRTLRRKQLFSDYRNHVLDLRDFDMRDVRAHGTITAGSTTLRLGHHAGFRVGDHVIVETGGEAGAGRRGTRGVGGTWPAKSYPTVGAMRADRAQREGLYSWVEESGDVYRWIEGAWHPQQGRHDYYIAKAIPLALQARILKIAGGVLLLDRPAAASARHAAVYVDNADVFNKLARDPRFDGELNYPDARVGPPGAPEYDFGSITPAGVTLRLPAGTFAIGRTLRLTNHDGWVIEGEGTAATRLVAPQGTPSAMLLVSRSPRTRVRAFALHGNARDQGYALQTSSNWQQVSETEVAQGVAYPSGVLFAAGSHESRAEDLAVTDVFQHAVGASFSDNVWAFRVHNVMTDGLRAYVQWQFQWADAVGGGCVDCSVTSPNLIPGFEAFKSRDITFIRPVGRNASVAMNAAGGFLIDEARLTVERGSQHGDRVFSEHNPLININANIDANHPYLELGGLIHNATMNQDYVNADNDLLRGIVVNTKNRGIRIVDGLYDAPDYKPPSRLSGPTGVLSTGTGTIVDGFRVNGVANPSLYPGTNIYVENGVVRNCVAETVYAGAQATAHGCSRHGPGR